MHFSSQLRSAWWKICAKVLPPEMKRPFSYSVPVLSTRALPSSLVTWNGAERKEAWAPRGGWACSHTIPFRIAESPTHHRSLSSLAAGALSLPSDSCAWISFRVDRLGHMLIYLSPFDIISVNVLLCNGHHDSTTFPREPNCIDFRSRGAAYML